MALEDVSAELETKTWFHRFQLAPGLWSPGKITVNAEAALDQYGFSRDLRGKRVIDIGTLDGAYAFEFERRGASVLAVDLQDPERTGFGLARRIIGSSVAYRVMSVYDLSPEAVGTFDVAWYWGVYYHLREPILAFRNIYRILNDNGLINFEGAVLDNAGNVEPSLAPRQRDLEAVKDLPLAYFVSGIYANDGSNWSIPNSTCLREWLKASGFKDISIRTTSERWSRANGTARKDPQFSDMEYPRY